MNTFVLTFKTTQFDIVDRNNNPWLRGLQIASALGYKNPSADIANLFDRNSDEFTDTMTALVELETEGGKQQVRVFSLRGCHLLAMLSRTKIAKEFRKWVLDILDHQIKPQYGLKSLASPFISEAEAARFQKSIKAHCAYNGKKYSDCYTTVYGQYGITKYTHIPAGKLEESARLIGMKLLPLKKQAIPAEPLKLEFTPEELEDLVAERIKTVAGEIMPKQPEEPVQHNSIAINLVPLENGETRRWIVTQMASEIGMFHSIPSDQLVQSKAKFMADIGGSKESLQELISNHIPLELLPWLINLSSERMGDCIQSLTINTTVAAAA